MDILDKLVDEKKRIICDKIYKIPDSFPEKIKDYFYNSLLKNKFNIIAEVKPASPVKGKLTSLSLPEMVEIYDKAKEVSALSVLTAESFSANLSNLQIARDLTQKPILQKDFILIPEQLYEGRLLGADAILLIARILTFKELESLYNLSLKLDLEPIIEVYDVKDLEKALALKPRIIMINNRDLSSFNLDIKNTPNLLPYIPEDVLVISASGIRTGEDIKMLYESGAKAVLVGESIVTSIDPYQKIKELFEGCGLKSVE
ncbi:MAG TPA: indole-3-glycerol-phosphate synthase [Dictyoglomaceae bacterium]|nr:indole-3-glycerol-phosphate synthase [Dictyoglomaceae bacterium]HOL39058.1 indole-3-glycerol-phosphate synthase [Dictyoglomaceae bacterium]HOP94397.1 indole-3-glycerol-phosphate synthase [Dictyoglomaceae bacterium]HPP15766.1 indole-3-glycerol-phosphate synthase [Dictyoglomaceae bacterium]HPU42755.1 indole-3-glycerol-phosphate synthase [Dictyoglomaceae bacterium]